MFTLALLLAFVAHQPQRVCITHHPVAPKCDYTYNSIGQAVTEHPDAVMWIKGAGRWVPLKVLLQNEQREQKLDERLRKKQRDIEEKRHLPRVIPISPPKSQ